MNPNFIKIAFMVNRIIHNRLKGISSSHGYTGQNVKCGITGEILKHFDMEVHHKNTQGKKRYRRIQ